MPTKVDFSGYATKNDVKCTDGVTIRHDAFKNNDGDIVPLVWQHLSNDPDNILGKAYLEHRDDGVYMYGSFNNNPKSQRAKELVQHGDITSMSIYANKIQKSGNDVIHGDILEVSLVTKGANSGAKIEHVTISHSDGTYDDLEDEIVIHSIGVVDSPDGDDMVIDEGDEVLEHADDEEDEVDDSDDGDETVEEVYNTLTDKQKTAVNIIIGAAVANAEPASDSTESSVKQSDKGGKEMKTNPFENQGTQEKGTTLTHADIEKVAKMTFDECQNHNVNFKTALKHATATYGIENIDLLFPEAKDISNTPQFVKRDDDWVNIVMNGVKQAPYSRIRSRFANITADEARARGYLKGNKKVEEVFPVLQRVTGPQTIYKLQKLDRDDILDITDFDVVAWLRQEMLWMLREEVARAILVGDGRLVTSTDKIKEDCIRPIWTDDEFYSYKLQLGATDDLDALADAFIRSRLHYEGAGRPVCFMAPETVTDLMLQRNPQTKERLYKTEAELADGLRVSRIIEVPVFYNLKRSFTPSGGTAKNMALKAIIVNLSDYTVGKDKGGQVTNFDDFDIDYNQYKYLIETRMSGALTAYHSAVVIEQEVAASKS